MVKEINEKLSEYQRTVIFILSCIVFAIILTSGLLIISISNFSYNSLINLIIKIILILILYFVVIHSMNKLAKKLELNKKRK